MVEGVCSNCGVCCIIPTTGKYCKHLIRLKSGRTLCRVYKTRLGRKIGENVYCMMREDVHINFVGCTMNRKEWEDK